MISNIIGYGRVDLNSALKSKYLEGLAVTGFVFGMMGFVFGTVGVVAIVRLEKLTKTLKQKGILEEDYKEE